MPDGRTEGAEESGQVYIPAFGLVLKTVFERQETPHFEILVMTEVVGMQVALLAPVHVVSGSSDIVLVASGGLSCGSVYHAYSRAQHP